MWLIIQICAGYILAKMIIAVFWRLIEAGEHAKNQRDWLKKYGRR